MFIPLFVSNQRQYMSTDDIKFKKAVLYKPFLQQNDKIYIYIIL